MADLDSTYGALFLGVLVSAVCVSFTRSNTTTNVKHHRLFGVTILQAFVYLQQYPHDSRWRKAAVYWLW